MPSYVRGTLPLPVRRIVRKLGSDIRDARLRGRIRASTMAERALISRTTLHKIERGDAGVSMGMYATVLFVLGMHDGIAELADRSRDGIGLDLLEGACHSECACPRPSDGGATQLGRAPRVPQAPTTRAPGSWTPPSWFMSICRACPCEWAGYGFAFAEAGRARRSNTTRRGWTTPCASPSNPP